MTLTRRAALALMLSSGAALAEAPARVMRPRYRGEGPPPPPPPPPLREVLAKAELSGDLGLALIDPATGRLIESQDAAVPRRPASVAKAVTALYALDALGPDYRFETRLLASAPPRDGVLEGDLILAGGGDPVLVTDDLATLAERLRATGLRQVTGRFVVWGGALPEQVQIDPGQLPHLGYNPAVGGLNLNFNRVYFEWARAGGDWRVTMDARSDRHRPPISIATMRVVDRDLPVYTYDQDGTTDRWTVARSALGEGGSRWLPVRRPALYAGEVFRTFAIAQGIDLQMPQDGTVPEGAVPLASLASLPLRQIVQDMLEFSTNLTAEVLGLTASRARGQDVATLADSAAAMSDWIGARFGATMALVDHSGLGDGSRVAAGQMARLLAAPGVADRLLPLLKPIALTDADGEALADPPGQIAAKTGTLNFVSTLAGYLTPEGGQPLAFAIFSADPARRAAAQASAEEQPDGAQGWARRSRRLQQVLLQRWAVLGG